MLVLLGFTAELYGKFQIPLNDRSKYARCCRQLLLALLARQRNEYHWLGSVSRRIPYEAQLRSRATILREARQQLNKKEVPANERERLLNLLSLLISGMGDTVLQNEDFFTLLLETVLNNGNLITIVERQAAELEALKHITRNLTFTLDLQMVLDQVVLEAMDLIKGSHEAHIYL
jgi:hypothetical protein